jgi:hypothetical protein
MVAANKSLLREVRKLAIREELHVMRLRGRLVMTQPNPGLNKPAAGGR